MKALKAIELATELRKLVEALEANPKLDVPKVFMSFGTSRSKEQFRALAHVLPRPLKKSLKNEGERFAEIELEYDSESLRVWASIPQAETCRLVSPAIPAKYECEPILSPEEDAALEAEVQQ